MSNYIAIDGGTTNTRINLVKDYLVTDTLSYNIGARKGIENKEILREAVKEGIEKILSRNDMTENDIERILVSGMLTSEFGIYEVNHISVPAGKKELHNAMAEVILSNISAIPFVFIPGVKTDCSSLENADMMRGEETELAGLTDTYNTEGLFVLPGSHSKIIKTDKEGRIIDFFTMLTGEMLEALSENTILRDAVDMKNTLLVKEYLLKGFEYAKSNGINEAMFKVRVLKNMFFRSADETYSFFLGAVLCDEVLKIINMRPRKVFIGGRKQIKTAIYEILKKYMNASVFCIEDEAVDKSVSLGMVKVYEFN